MQGGSESLYGGSQSSRQSYRGRGSRNYSRSDDRIKEDLNERLAMDHDVDASDIDVEVKEGAVTLSGQVEDRSQKYRASRCSA